MPNGHDEIGGHLSESSEEEEIECPSCKLGKLDSLGKHYYFFKGDSPFIMEISEIKLWKCLTCSKIFYEFEESFVAYNLKSDIWNKEK